MSYQLTLVNKGRWVPLRLQGDQTVTEIVDLWTGAGVVSRRRHDYTESRRPWLPMEFAGPAWWTK